MITSTRFSGASVITVIGASVNEGESYRYDDVDLLILTALDEDARMTVMALAGRCGLARGTVQARLERYRSLGLLRCHSVRVDPAHLGRGLSAMVSAELDQHLLGEAVLAVSRIPEPAVPRHPAHPDQRLPTPRDSLSDGPTVSRCRIAWQA